MAGENMDAKALSREAFAFCALLGCLQLTVLVLFVALGFEHSGIIETNRYAYFRDVNIMIFFGFGFLMTFLRRYGYSAVAYTLIISAIVVQLSLLLEYGFSGHEDVPKVGLVNLMNGLFTAGAVMISFGAVLGKVTPFQLLVMALLEAVLFWVNVEVSVNMIGAHDVGGGMTIHTFGAYFGLAVSASFSGSSSKSHPDNASNYTSDITALAGTLMLWLLWPSFNAAVAGTEAEQSRAVVNTFISLAACTVATAITSRLLNGKKFDVVHIQNATLAGGVAMGVAGDLPTVGLHGAILGGFAAGALSCVGYAKISPVLERLGIQDTCGVHNLHGMPGLISAIIGIITADALPQLYATLITLGIGLVGGTVTGVIMKQLGKTLGTQLQFDHFNDKSFWNTASDYGAVVDEEAFGTPEYIFFYGTMKQGFHNDHRFKPLMQRYNGSFEGSAKADLLLFVDMYGCPYAAFDAPRRGAARTPTMVKGELVRFEGGVPSEVLAKLDEFEQVPNGRYHRRTLKATDSSGKAVEAIVYGIEAARIPGLMDGVFDLLEDYTLELHKSKYVPREQRDAKFKQSWGGYVDAMKQTAASTTTEM